MKKILITSTLLLSITTSQAFDFGGFMDSVKDVVPALNETVKSSDVNEKPATGTTSNLADSSVADGLKEALKQGVDYAVKELSKEGGYLNNPAVKIPLPQGLSNVEDMIRNMGGDKMADDFINSMNDAAAKSAVKATPIFVSAIEKMSIEDAKKILAGNENAATEYFKLNTTEDLKKMMKPIIEETIEENNVASYYDTLNEYYDSTVKTVVENESIRDMAKNFGMDQYMPKGTTDEKLDDYVTRNAIDGLFKMIAVKEAEIRKDPVAQSSSLLKKVFGK
ncbi:DUF4197 domain-containing protein [Sulfurimonas sp.]|nr:DUF4197 domain-containing protein [Sulfurimonas sp.]